MFLTKKYIPRRTFLRGAGVALGLPLLEAMLPAQTPEGQTAAVAPPRFVGIWHPHGAAPGYWSPETAGSDFEFSYTLSPLEPFRNSFTCFTGLDATAAMPTAEEPGGDHQRASVLLTGTRPRVNAVIPYGGVSIDQMIAQQHGQDTMIPSLQVGIEDPGNNTGVCNFGYSCAYTNSITWATPTQPLPHQINPRVVFDRLFGYGATAEERAASRSTDRSILDSITRQAPNLRAAVGTGDRARIDRYLDDVREIERRLQIAEKASLEAPSTDVPFGVPESFTEHVHLMWDLTTLAFQSDLTRVMTMMYGRDVTQRTHPESGFEGPWHTTSHHDDVPERVKNYATVNRYMTQLGADLAQRLQDSPEGNGNVLDNTIIFDGSNMGNSHRHDHWNSPFWLVGNVAGQLKGNQHFRYPGGTQRASNLLLDVLDLYGIHRDAIGDSTGRLNFV